MLQGETERETLFVSSHSLHRTIKPQSSPTLANFDLATRFSLSLFHITSFALLFLFSFAVNFSSYQIVAVFVFGELFSFHGIMMSKRNLLDLKLFLTIHAGRFFYYYLYIFKFCVELSNNLSSCDLWGDFGRGIGMF